MRYSANIYTARGDCPCCNAPMKDISLTWGDSLIVIFHDADNFSNLSNQQLLSVRLCSINRVSGERMSRNYELSA